MADGPTLIRSLYPLLRTLELAGLSPLEYLEEGVRTISWKSFKAFRIILNLGLMTIYLSCILIGSMAHLQRINRRVLITDLVEVGVGIYGNSLRICILINSSAASAV
jgi:hypothetical protein